MSLKHRGAAFLTAAARSDAGLQRRQRFPIPVRGGHRRPGDLAGDRAAVAAAPSAGV